MSDTLKQTIFKHVDGAEDLPDCETVKTSDFNDLYVRSGRKGNGSMRGAA